MITPPQPDAKPAWPMCMICDSVMVYNVPHLGAAGGYVHQNTRQFLCDDKSNKAGK